MPPLTESPDVDPSSNASKLLRWLYRNSATLLLALVIALSSIVWREVATTLDGMRGDIRDLTKKMGEVVTNQSVQRQMIETNSRSIDGLEERIKQNEGRWRDEWRRNQSSNQ